MLHLSGKKGQYLLPPHWEFCCNVFTINGHFTSGMAIRHLVAGKRSRYSGKKALAHNHSIRNKQTHTHNKEQYFGSCETCQFYYSSQPRLT